MPNPQDIFQLAQQTATQVTASPESWRRFLYTAAHNYHTTYLNQLLIHAQRPDATACATMKYWNEQAHRKVMYGSKSIIILQRHQGVPTAKRVFSMTDTVLTGDKAAAPWEVTDAIRPLLMQVNSVGSLMDRATEQVVSLSDRANRVMANSIEDSTLGWSHPEDQRFILQEVAAQSTLYMGHTYELTEGTTTHRLAAALNLNSLLLHPFRLSADAFSLGCGIATALMAGLIYLCVKYSRHRLMPQKEYGSARWGTPEDIVPFVNKDPSENLPLTATESLSLSPKMKVTANDNYNRNKNVIVFGPSGSGKSYSVAGPQLLQFNSNYVISDPKGELPQKQTSKLQSTGRSSFWDYPSVSWPALLRLRCWRLRPALSVCTGCGWICRSFLISSWWRYCPFWGWASSAVTVIRLKSS